MTEAYPPYRNKSDCIKQVQLDMVWNVCSSTPRLAEALEKSSPGTLAALDSFGKEFPAARTFHAFDSPPFTRPKGHLRAFYMSTGSGTLAIKGTEIACDDLEQAFDSFQDKINPLSEPVLEYFPNVEHKVPMGLLLSEAREEMKKSLEFQSRYFDRYGELAPAPVPVRVMQWPDQDVSVFRSRFLGRSSRRAMGIIDRLLPDGLGVFVYAYPRLPLRVRHMADTLRPFESKGFNERYSELLRSGCDIFPKFDPRLVIDSWIRTVVRMFGLGYFPCTLSHRAVGQCVREQNAVIDGGFVDFDSLQPMSEIRGEREFYETFLLSWTELSSSVMRFLCGYMGSPPSSYLVFLLGNMFVLSEMKRIFIEESEAGIKFDPRLHEFLKRSDSIEGLRGALSSLFPPPSAELGHH